MMNGTQFKGRGLDLTSNFSYGSFFSQLISRPDMGYDTKILRGLLSPHLPTWRYGWSTVGTVAAFQTSASSTSGSERKLEANQLVSCFKRSDRWSKCRGYLRGRSLDHQITRSPVKRPRDMERPCDFPPPDLHREATTALIMPIQRTEERFSHSYCSSGGRIAQR